MKYYKIINGSTVIKDKKSIIIYKNGKQIINPSEEFIINDGWLPYSPEVVEDVDEFETTINNLIDSVQLYDKSNNVEEFYINEIPLWLDRDERAILQRRFEIELKNGIHTSTLWKNEQSFSINISDGMLMLDQLELYAIKCFDNTQLHINEIKHITNLDSAKAYDYTTGYPDKLHFVL